MGDDEVGRMTDGPRRRCAWCEAESDAAATTCSACGAALAQREDLGGLRLSGVTAVDPALADVADRPMRITGGGPSATQAVAPALIVGAVLGGPVGLAAIGGVAAVAGAELAGARRPGLTAPGDLAAVGDPGDLARRVAERLDAEERDGSAAPGDAGAAAGPEPVVDGSAANSDNSARD